MDPGLSVAGLRVPHDSMEKRPEGRRTMHLYQDNLRSVCNRTRDCQAGSFQQTGTELAAGTHKQARTEP